MLAIFIGMCTRVTSPTSSKNPRSASGVVLNAKLPTHTEFCRFGTLDGASSAVFFTFSLFTLRSPSSESSSSLALDSVFCSFLRCRRCSACESTGTSSAGASSASLSSDELLLASDDTDGARLRFCTVLATLLEPSESEAELEDMGVQKKKCGDKMRSLVNERSLA